MSDTSLLSLSKDDVACVTDRGVGRIGGVLSADDLIKLDALFPRLPERTAGARGEAFTLEAQKWLASHLPLAQLASCILGCSSARIARMQAFNKFPGANWFVPWHQDRAEDGVERPIEKLERTIALRIHLDECNEDSGPLEVLPGSHRHGRLSASDIRQYLTTISPYTCLANRGEIIAMRPLLVHRSQRAGTPSPVESFTLNTAPDLF